MDINISVHLIRLLTLKIANDLVTFTPYSTFVIVSLINDPTRYAQLLRERRKTAMTHTQSFVGEGFGEKYSEW